MIMMIIMISYHCIAYHCLHYIAGASRTVSPRPRPARAAAISQRRTAGFKNVVWVVLNAPQADEAKQVAGEALTQLLVEVPRAGGRGVARSGGRGGVIVVVASRGIVFPSQRRAGPRADNGEAHGDKRLSAAPTTRPWK